MSENELEKAKFDFAKDFFLKIVDFNSVDVYKDNEFLPHKEYFRDCSKYAIEASEIFMTEWKKNHPSKAISANAFIKK